MGGNEQATRPQHLIEHDRVLIQQRLASNETPLDLYRYIDNDVIGRPDDGD